MTDYFQLVGYSETQRRELEETINRTDCDLVLVATPIDLARTIKLDKPSVRVTYEVQEIGKRAITEMLEEFTHTHKTSVCRSGEVA